ncbi:hypothetical protein B0H19DRAFT_1172558 [Mycena capillaripes]|nr:hypothetical protein B0H19DRAFT_1172558 [Mycena capillaripes]
MPVADTPEFSGDPDGGDKMTSKSFLKKVRIQLRADQLQDDKERIAAVVDYLKDNSPAEKWHHDLLANANPPTTWQNYAAAFVTRFPTPEKAERTPQEYERELTGMRLTVEELDMTVDVSGEKVFSHVHFAEHMLELAKLAGIDSTASGIWQVRDELPDVIRDKVFTSQKDWKSFTDSIKGIDRVHIREGAKKAKKARDIERTVEALASRDKGRQPPTTPVSKMSAQLAQTALATPRANTAPAATNPFSAGGGRGNLFGQAPQSESMTPEKLKVLKEIVDKLKRGLLRDDAAGRAEYARRITVWNTTFAGMRPALEDVGYPISPGTVAPGSGECFGCGKITTPLHRGNECPGPKVPRMESTFRSIVNKHLRPAPAQVNAVLDWMDFDDTEEEDFLTGPSE